MIAVAVYLAASFLLLTGIKKARTPKPPVRLIKKRHYE